MRTNLPVREVGQAPSNTDFPMPHAHLPVSHLIHQLAAGIPRRSNRDRRPRWLSRLVADAAELFEPTEGTARVGFSCWPTEEGWVAELYLGAEEHVGGPKDGLSQPVSFRFDLLELANLVDEVTELTFEVGAADRFTIDPPRRATLHGRIGQHPVTIHISAAPPRDAEAGLRRYPNGRREIRE